MKQPIKYRVWDKEQYKFTNKLTAIYQNGIIVIYNPEAGQYYQPSQDNFIPVFFTGRKDKSGKESFSEDIIRFKLSSGEEVQGVIEYVEDNAAFEVKVYGYRELDPFHVPMSQIFYFDIIGDQFNNPKLLK
jgi:hypothetical protein